MQPLSAPSADGTVRRAKRKAPSAIDYRKMIVDHRRLQHELSRIMEISSGIIYIIDPEGKFTFLNRAVEEILHYPPEELIGKHFSVIMPEGEYQRVSRDHVLSNYVGKVTGPDNAPKLFDERRTGARRTRNLEVRFITKEQSEIKVLSGDVTGIISAEGAYDKSLLARGEDRDKAFLGSQGIIYDITKYKEMESEKVELERHLHEMRRMENLGRFAGGVAHDLNNKLGIIMGYAEIILKKHGSADPDLHQCADTISSCSRGAAELTDQLLAFARQGPIENEDVDVNQVVLKASRLVRHMLDPRTQIRCTCHARASVVKGDRTALQNAVLAIAMQAGQMATKPGDLLFATRETVIDAAFAAQHGIVGNPGPSVAVTVIHTGVPPEAHAELKRPFTESADDAHQREGGMGYVVHCVRSHRGLVEAVEDGGGGVRFDLYFPATSP